MNIAINTPQSQKALYDTFMDVYELSDIAFAGPHHAALRPEQERTCRFCKKSHPQTSFSDKPHKIPYLLGNPGLIWDEECESCNNFFSTFETNLSYYLGVLRPLFDIQGGGKFPTFSNKDANVEIKKLAKDFMRIERKDLDKGFQFDAEKAEFSIDVSRRSYVPAYVYNAFLKIALSLLPENDVPDYAPAFRYLMEKDHYNDLKGVRMLWIAECNHSYNFPIAALFRRKNEDSTIPLHTLCLYVKQFMFQIIFPMRVNDISSQQKDITILQAPYLDYTQKMGEPVTVKRYTDDLHSTEKFDDKENWLRLQLDPEALKNLSSVKIPDGAFNDFLKGKK